MLTKTVLIGCAALSTPFWLLPATGIENAGAKAAAAAAKAAAGNPAQETRRNSELQRLREALRKAKRGADTALRQLNSERDRAAKLKSQLAECMDFLVANTTRQRQSCRPSRRLLTHYQWMHRNGHDKHANKILEHIVRRNGGDNADQLNHLARRLMTSKDYAGKFDELALALTTRMQKSGRKLRCEMLDTIALASFLNGNVDDAIRFQQQAVNQSRHNDDYVRRLRTYEAAKDIRPAERRVEIASSED